MHPRVELDVFGSVSADDLRVADLREWHRVHGDDPPFRLTCRVDAETPQVEAWLRDCEQRIYRRMLQDAGIE